MSLHVRVYLGFFASRKTMRLRAKIGDAALWVPVRLWTYAAANQPDGVFKDYSAEEIAYAIEYPGDAKAMLEAMLQAGFLDSEPLRIHQWDEHNGYHAKYKERASYAAKARWSKRDQGCEDDVEGQAAPPAPPKEIGKDRIGKETSIASSMLEASGGQVPELVLVPETPPKPKVSGWTPTPTQLRLNRLFSRRDTTKWSAKEVSALKEIGEIDELDFAAIEFYYTLKIPAKDDHRRHDLCTLLNNWPGELDRAKRAGGVRSVEEKEAAIAREMAFLEGGDPWGIENKSSCEIPN